MHLMFTVRFLYPRISFLPLSAINTHSHYAEINSGSKKKHTLKNSRRHFCFCLVWLFELTFFSNKSYQNRQVPVCKGDNPNIKYESFELMCIQTLFSRPAHSNSLVMELLLICLYSKLADFFRNFTFDSHRDLKLSRTQENVKFKYFSRSMVIFQMLFKTNFVFKDFSRLPFIFKYFSSLCEPCQFTKPHFYWQT